MASQAAVIDECRGGHIPPPEPADIVATRIEVHLLGGFEVWVDGRQVGPGHWSRRHSSALVKLLALSPGRSLHRELVIDALWPDIDIEDAAPRLHKAAHYARRALGHRDAVVLSAEAVSLLPHDEVWVDAAQFRQLADDALRNGGIESAEGALALYGGDLLPRDVYEPWAELHRVHLRRLYLEMLHQAEDWHQALAADPTDESAHLALVERYAERGNRVAALRQLDQLDHVMRDDLGLDPSERAQKLREQVARGASGNLSSDRRKCVGEAPRPVGAPPSTCCG